MNMNPVLSVILCTHNPRVDYLYRVLTALKQQTLPYGDWELLFIDNASEQVLASQIELTWHVHGRHIREEKLGLTSARLRGIEEAIAPILVFVDDDNVLDHNYLETVLAISQNFPRLGAWGGQIRADFEAVPPEWATPYLGYLAIRSFEQDQWSNLLHQYETTPCGAGLCVRKIVAETYADYVRYDTRRLNLDRKGTLLMSGGDSDLAFTACDIGSGTGVFTALKLTHLISAHRVTETYLLRLMEGMTYSHILLDSLRGKQFASSISWQGRLFSLYRFLKMSPRERRFEQAIQRGKSAAIQVLTQTDLQSRTQASVVADRFSKSSPKTSDSFQRQS
jgi:glycosyltransferase involved in cell wall biosynthesis